MRKYPAMKVDLPLSPHESGWEKEIPSQTKANHFLTIKQSKMKRYTLFIKLTILFFLAGVISIAFVDKHFGMLFFTFICFLGSIWSHELAMKEWIIIKDNASMDRPE